MLPHTKEWMDDSYIIMPFIVPPVPQSTAVIEDVEERLPFRTQLASWGRYIAFPICIVCIVNLRFCHCIG